MGAGERGGATTQLRNGRPGDGAAGEALTRDGRASPAGRLAQRTPPPRKEVIPMAEILLSVLAGVLSAAAWELIKWACASLKGAKKPAPDDEPSERA